MINWWLSTVLKVNFNPISWWTHDPPIFSNWPIMWVLWYWFYVDWVMFQLCWIVYYYCYKCELNMNYWELINGDHSLGVLVRWPRYLSLFSIKLTLNCVDWFCPHIMAVFTFFSTYIYLVIVALKANFHGEVWWTCSRA